MALARAKRSALRTVRAPGATGHWLLLCACVLACSAGGATAPTAPVRSVPEPQALTAITVKVDTPTLVMGHSASALATGIDQHGAFMTVGVAGWTSMQPGIASVGADGVIIARSPGQAIIVATIGPVQGQATVVVTPLPPGPLPVATVSVSPFAASLEAGRILQLTVTPKDLAGAILADRTITWTTSDSTIAAVSPNGLVTANAIGSAIIEATCEGKRGALALTVTAASDTSVKVTVAAPLPLTVVGDTVHVIATAQSIFPITGVTATIGGKVLDLTYGHIGGGERAMGWSGTVNISLLAFGPWDLIVTATDDHDHLGVASIPFVRNPKVVGGSRPPSGNK